MASQPPDPGRDRNQVRPLRSTVSSVRGKADRHRSTGLLGSHFVLDGGGSPEQAARFQDLLQQPSHPYLNGRANAESGCVTTNRKSPLDRHTDIGKRASAANRLSWYPTTREQNSSQHKRTAPEDKWFISLDSFESHVIACFSATLKLW